MEVKELGREMDLKAKELETERPGSNWD